MGLWVPPRVQQQMLAEQRDYEHSIREQSLLGEIVQRWDPELKQVSPYLHLIKAADDATELGLKPGYWHFLLNPPGTAATLIPLEGPNGEFREPGSWMFRFLDESDAWDSRVIRDRRERKQRLEDAERRARDREKEDRIVEFDERWKARTRAQVSMAGRWSQNVAGRRGRAT